MGRYRPVYVLEWDVQKVMVTDSAGMHNNYTDAWQRTPLSLCSSLVMGGPRRAAPRSPPHTHTRSLIAAPWHQSCKSAAVPQSPGSLPRSFQTTKLARTDPQCPPVPRGAPRPRSCHCAPPMAGLHRRAAISTQIYNCCGTSSVYSQCTSITPHHLLEASEKTASNMSAPKALGWLS